MALEIIILLIILIPVIILALIRRKQHGATDLAALLRLIMGNFLFVCGIMLLFPAFYLLFNGEGGNAAWLLLVVSLLIMVCGNYLASRSKTSKQKGCPP